MYKDKNSKISGENCGESRIPLAFTFYTLHFTLN